jgi:hypothetical protein
MANSFYSVICRSGEAALELHRERTICQGGLSQLAGLDFRNSQGETGNGLQRDFLDGL